MMEMEGSFSCWIHHGKGPAACFALGGVDFSVMMGFL